jgi:hypothetical protein
MSRVLSPVVRLLFQDLTEYFLYLIQSVLEMGRYKLVCQTRTFLFPNFIPALINICYIHLYLSILVTICPYFAFKEYTGTSKFQFRALGSVTCQHCWSRLQPFGIHSRVVSLKQSDVSEVCTASIIKAMALMMETLRSSETSVYFNEIPRRCIAEGCRLHTCRRENFEV